MCRHTADTSNLTIRNYYYGPKCSQKPKSFWLRLFQPFTSGLSGDEFIKKEMELDKKLKVIENLTILEANSTCPFSKDHLALKTLSYLGDTSLEESLYEEDLSVLLEYNATSDLLCNHKQFLSCHSNTNTCLTIDSRFFWDNETSTLHYGTGQNCFLPVSPLIPKVFYEPYEVNCAPNSFCVIDLSQEDTFLEDPNFPSELRELNATCHCPRHSKGITCNELLLETELQPYNSIEQARLEKLLQIIKSKSSLKYGDNCSLHVEESLDPLQLLQNSEGGSSSKNVDLYFMYYILSRVLINNTKEQFPNLFEIDTEFGLCNKQQFLTCTSFSLSSSYQEIDSSNLNNNKANHVEALCDCAPGLEWKVDKCYISDGKQVYPNF